MPPYNSLFVFQLRIPRGSIQHSIEVASVAKSLPQGSVVSQEESLQYTEITNSPVTPANDLSLHFNHDLIMEGIMQGLMTVKETPSKLAMYGC